MIGTYCLIIEIKEKSTIKVGALGIIKFEKGYYIYVGSAMNSLVSRIKRHMKDDKKLHWHIDYLLKNKNSRIDDIIFAISSKNIECKLSQYIKNLADNQVDNFGCSDCKCISHLYYFKKINEAKQSSINGYKNENLDYKNLDYFNKINK